MAGGANDGGRHPGHHRRAVWSGVAALMVLPLIGIDLAGGTAPPPGDLVFLAILMVGVGAAHELTARVGGRSAYRIGVGMAMMAALLLIWINLAVGIIGSEDNPANAIYGGVVAVAAAGALLARFRSVGMARAMTAAAIAQALAFLVVLVAGLGFTGPITVFFGALWLLSAWSFRKAAREPFPRPA